VRHRPKQTVAAWRRKRRSHRRVRAAVQRRPRAGRNPQTMTDCTSCAPTPPTLLLRGVDANLLAQFVCRHEARGGAVERFDALPPSPRPAARGAIEAGKGALIDVVA
jgi:hypothetical protein